MHAFLSVLLDLFIVMPMQGQTASHAAMVLSPLPLGGGVGETSNRVLQQGINSNGHFVDVSGGSGTFCIEICKALPPLERINLRNLICQRLCPITETNINTYDDRYPPTTN